MDRFYFSIGEYIRIPLIDFSEGEYTARLRYISSVISVIVEKWDFFQKGSSGIPEKARLLGYSIRKVAGMLPCSDIQRLADQDFIRSALLTLKGNEVNRPGVETAEEAMTILCDGFSKVQYRLEMDLSPFGYCSIPFIEMIHEQRSSTAREAAQESQNSRIKHLLMAN